MTEVEEIKQRIMDTPVIAAVKDEKGLEEALKSECGVIFLLFGTIVDIGKLTQRVKVAGKVAIVHMDLVEGLSNREIAVDGLVRLSSPDGIISTRAGQIRRGRQIGLVTIQRAFILDSMSIETLQAQISAGQQDFVVFLPGIMPRVITEIVQETQTPVIAGGLIKYKEEVIAAIQAGAVAVSSTCRAVWEM